MMLFQQQKLHEILRDEEMIFKNFEADYVVRFQVFAATNMKVTVFWDVAPCSLIEVHRGFRGTCCLHHQGD
jgi:hypothetical protein